MDLQTSVAQRRFHRQGADARRRIKPLDSTELRARHRSRELAATLAWELPFWIMMLFWGYGPSVWTPWYFWRGLPFCSKDLALIFVAAWYFLLAIVSGRWRDRHCAGAYGKLPLVAVVLLVYAGASLWWGSVERPHIPGAFYTLVMTAAAYALAYSMLQDRSAASTRAFLARMTFFLVVTTAIYGTESIFRLGLRSQYGIGEFGIPRLCGPLYDSATGYLILVPAFAFALQELMIQDRVDGFGWKLAATGILFGGIMALGSRGAIVALGAFIFLVVCLRKGVSKIQIIVFVGILGLVAVVVLTCAKANFERVTHFECNGRQFTHETAWRIVANSTTTDLVRGAGYGAYWPWYSRGGWLGRDTPDYYLPNVYRTEYGLTLFHPHSVFLLLSVELGLLGLVAFLFLWKTLATLVLRYGADHRIGLIACGLFASAMALFFDTFFFKCQKTSCIWCIYLLGALRMASTALASRHAAHADKQVSMCRDLKPHQRQRIGAGQ